MLTILSGALEAGALLPGLTKKKAPPTRRTKTAPMILARWRAKKPSSSSLKFVESVVWAERGALSARAGRAVADGLGRRRGATVPDQAWSRGLSRPPRCERLFPWLGARAGWRAASENLPREKRPRVQEQRPTTAEARRSRPAGIRMVRVDPSWRAAVIVPWVWSRDRYC